ncbi:MAG: hypothetical protein JJE07_12835 [Flavobacteriaceae bacterium]|nr:hypothetical protein [Flavobacteriaceae bacterium]
MGAEFVRALKEDRKSIFSADTIRSLVFVILSATLIWLYLKQKASKNLVIAGFVLLILADLIGVDRRYVNNEDFVASKVMNQPFQKTAADVEILKDKGHYRVFDLAESPFNTGRTSYFHNSIGGYHAAKPGRMQNLFDFYIAKNNLLILNMLNVKYIIVPTEEGTQAQQNPEAFGNAWFVENIKWVSNTNEEILNLGETDLVKTAVINNRFKDQIPSTLDFDPSAQIELIEHEPNKLVYRSSAAKDQLVVFSEMYYGHGWISSIDDKETPHILANYALRAMMVPAGEHIITFKFEPKVVKKGSTIALISSIILGFLLLGGIYFTFKIKDQDV